MNKNPLLPPTHPLLTAKPTVDISPSFGFRIASFYISYTYNNIHIRRTCAALHTSPDTERKLRCITYRNRTYAGQLKIYQVYIYIYIGIATNSILVRYPISNTIYINLSYFVKNISPVAQHHSRPPRGGSTLFALL